MKRFAARLFAWVAALSLVLCVLTVTVWVRSQRTTDLLVRTVPVSHADPTDTGSPVVFDSRVYGCSGGFLYSSGRTIQIEADALREGRAPSELHYYATPTQGHDRRKLPGLAEPAATYNELPLWLLVLLTAVAPVGWIVTALRRLRENEPQAVIVRSASK